MTFYKTKLLLKLDILYYVDTLQQSATLTPSLRHPSIFLTACPLKGHTSTRAYPS